LEGIQPWGQRRQDLRFARLAWLILSALAAKGKAPRWPQIAKLFDFDVAGDERTDEQIGLLFRQIGKPRKKKG
jgi:hypothetical protein